jgi:hypothetical protein
MHLRDGARNDSQSKALTSVDLPILLSLNLVLQSSPGPHSTQNVRVIPSTISELRQSRHKVTSTPAMFLLTMRYVQARCSRQWYVHQRYFADLRCEPLIGFLPIPRRDQRRIAVMKTGNSDGGDNSVHGCKLEFERLEDEPCRRRLFDSPRMPELPVSVAPLLIAAEKTAGGESNRGDRQEWGCHPAASHAL